MKISLDSIAKIFLAFFIFEYVLLPLFFPDNVCSVVKSGTLLCLAIVLEFNKEKNRSALIEFSTVLLFGLTVIQILIFKNIEGIKLLINVICFFVFFRNASVSFACCFIKLIKFGALFAVVSVFYFCIKYQVLYYFRDLIGIQKQTLSILFLLGGFFCFCSVIFYRSGLSTLLFCLFLFFNLFVVQSKSSLLVTFLQLLFFFCMDKVTRRKFKRTIRQFVLISIIVTLFFPSIALPDDIRYGINRISGIQFFSESTERSEEKLSMTYDIRGDLVTGCLNLFNESPIFGVGMGNFAKISQKKGNMFYGLSETESEWLGILTEGGITYFAVFLFFCSAGLYKSFRLHKINYQNKLGLVAFIFLAGYLIMFIFNDFMDSIFWIGLGCLLGGGVSFHKISNINENINNSVSKNVINKVKESS